MSARSHTHVGLDSGALLAAGARTVIGMYQPLLQPLNLTHPQYLVLLALDQQNPQSCVQLSERLHITPGTMTPLLRRLDTLGLVRRGRNPLDDRELEVSLTPRGRELLPALWKINEQVRNAVRAAIPDFRQLQATLSRIALAPI